MGSVECGGGFFRLANRAARDDLYEGHEIGRPVCEFDRIRVAPHLDVALQLGLGPRLLGHLHDNTSTDCRRTGRLGEVYAARTGSKTRGSEMV